MTAQVLLLTLTVCFGLELRGQTSSSFEVCGVRFHLGMTREEVKARVVIPGLRQLVDGDQVVLNHVMFGLSASSECYGRLDFRDDRVIEIQRTLTSTTNAVALVRTLFLQIRNLNESTGSTGTVTTSTSSKNAKDFHMLKETVRFAFGHNVIQIDSEEGMFAEQNIGPITTISVGLSSADSQKPASSPK
jgi:hypothetical protein